MSGERSAARWRLASLALAVAIAFAAAALILRHSATSVRDLADGLGPATPIVFVALATVLTCALFPFPLIAAASGLLFGTALGTVVSIVAGTCGAVAAFLIARRWGARSVQTLASARVASLLDAVGRRGFVAVLYLRIVPGVPRDIANYGAGVVPIGLAPYTGATVLGIAPRAFAYTVLGSSLGLGDLRSPEAIVAVVLLVLMGLLGLALLHRDRRLRRRRGRAVR